MLYIPTASSTIIMEVAVVPGIFVANSGVLPAYQAVLPYDNFVKWYTEVHIPDWMGQRRAPLLRHDDISLSTRSADPLSL